MEFISLSPPTQTGRKENWTVAGNRRTPIHRQDADTQSFLTTDESASADEVGASSPRLLRFDKQEIFCRPFRLLPFCGIRRDKLEFSAPRPGHLLVWQEEGEIFCWTFTQGGTAFAPGYCLSLRWSFQSVFIRVHPWLKPQFLEPVLHFLEMEFERAELLQFVIHDRIYRIHRINSLSASFGR
jgi:hypothetical protein